MWAQIRPPRARLQVTTTVAAVVVLIASVAAWFSGVLHPRLSARTDIAVARGDVLAMTIEIDNDSYVPVHVTGVREHQRGVELVGAGLASAPADSAPTSRLAVFTISAGGARSLTIYSRIDCASLNPPLRIQIGTRWLVGHQTSDVTLSDAAVPALQQLCPANAF
jgi:hypothetical protein